MEKVRFGVIGCGFAGGFHADILSHLSGAELVACCDHNAGAGQALARQHGCKFYADPAELLADTGIDAVTVCLPSGMHHDVTVMAARAGKHILCEKPIDIDPDRAQDMVDTARECGVKFGVIMQHRFDPAVQLLCRALRDGTLGRAIWGASRTIWYRDEDYFNSSWRGSWAVDGGGALINQSIHYIDLLVLVLGEVTSVSAKCRTLLHRRIETEDVGVANLEFANGSIGTVEGTTAAWPGLYTELSVFCENGSVTIRNDALASYHLKSGKNEAFEALLDPESATSTVAYAKLQTESHRRQYEDFMEAIAQDRAPGVTGEDALKSLRVIRAIYRASQEKREVFLRE